MGCKYFLRSFEMKTIANKKLFAGMLVFVLVFNVVLTGCSTTTSSIDYASAAQPKGAYKHASISVQSSFGNGSVLQRFYAEYPSDEYEVVAIEKQDKKLLRNAITIGGTLLGAMLGGAFVGYDYGTYSTSGPLLTGGGAILFGVPAFFVGNIFFKDDYIITYVER
jgi:hypothetical protein